jgi:predicted metal-dependent hydrolase
VLAPSDILAYVVLHELCHLREFNHSRSFWRLLESVRPDWREQAAWLRLHGHELHEYQPASGLVSGPDLG